MILDMFTTLGGLVDDLDCQKRKVWNLERKNEDLEARIACLKQQGSRRSSCGSGSSSERQRGSRTSGAPNENNRVHVPTLMSVPHFGMVRRMNGRPMELVGGGSEENPFWLREFVDLIGEEESGPTLSTSRHRGPLVEISNDIPAKDPLAYGDHLAHHSSVDRAD
jgi:hypothetical protein